MARPAQGSMSLILAPFSNKQNSDSSIRFVTLRHPRTKLPVLYGVSNSNCVSSEKCNGHEVDDRRGNNLQFLEVQSINEEYGAWAIGENILGGTRSSAHLCTPFDPLMIILPYLMIGKERNMVVPLEDLIHDVLTEEDQDSNEKIESSSSIIDELLKSNIVTNRLHKIADSVGSKDLNVWKWNEDKSLSFLSAKVIRLEKRLQLNKSSIADDGGVDIGYTARNNTTKRLNADRVDQRYLRLAWEIMSDYLPESLSQKLAQKLNINLNESQALTPLAKKAKLDNPVSTGPLDDYTKGKKPLSNQAKKAEPTAKQKAASRACAGTKSIASFFSKK